MINLKLEGSFHPAFHKELGQAILSLEIWKSNIWYKKKDLLQIERNLTGLLASFGSDLGRIFEGFFDSLLQYRSLFGAEQDFLEFVL
ncbi:MAG: hypothetical protein RBG13Loki_1619 [Promethearchaeota archaeon CR_4]|nr:MAG: hypothetical protein RBG13Loki_1619 [Candidatus Lokiarchaeota archaeon CR_4]